MGAHHSTTGTTAGEPSDDDYPMDQHAILSQYKIQHRLFPGSGRMMKTYQLKHKTNEATAVIKALWVDVSQVKQQFLKEQHEELLRIQAALGDQPHVAPFTYWVHQTDFFTTTSLLRQQRQPVYLLRPYVYTTLSDRLASRPFFTAIEKLWMIHQILQALEIMHQHKVCHGFLTTENVGLTSWNWVVLLDVSSYKARTTLPDDDPSEYLYYFQDHHHQDSIFSMQDDSTSSSNQYYYHGNNTNNTNPSSLDANNNPNSTTTGGSTTTSGTTTTTGSSKKVSRNREKRCYIAPERFVSGTATTAQQQPTTATTTTTTSTITMTTGGAVDNTNSNFSKYNQLTPAMDIFSAGCVMMELWLNGDRALDLGDLLEYRRHGTTTLHPQSSLQQKLHKIESSALRAACKHMVQLDASSRLSAKAYLERLQAADALPKVMETCLEPLLQHVADPKHPASYTPDARLALAALHYENVLWETLGIRDPEGTEYLKRVLGPTLVELEHFGDDSKPKKEGDSQDSATFVNAGNSLPPTRRQSSGVEDLFAKTEALLKKLDSLSLLEGDLNAELPAAAEPITPAKTVVSITASPKPATAPRSALCKSSLLIYLHLIIASVRHVQRPASKLVALQMLTRLCDLCDSDEIRLQRMVPVSISLLQDQDALVRASALKFLAHVVSQIQSFPPSDSKIFPQYIFKRVSPLLTDLSLVVRLAFCQSIATLAETAQRFLDISHAVRLYEAIGAGSSNSSASAATAGTDQDPKRKSKKKTTTLASPNVFSDDMAKLLGDDTTLSSNKKEDPDNDANANAINKRESGFHGGSLGASPSGKTLINSTYQEELTALQETVSGWVVHITTDPSEHSSPTKRALLESNLSRLCTFFGLEGVMAFILPQVLAFLNDRKDAQLRTALFRHLPSVCRIVGRASCEHFVLPCLESGLVDGEEQVVAAAIRCLAELIELGLISRSVLLGNLTVSSTPDSMVELASDG
jgi:serine/threonine protein kinase